MSGSEDTNQGRRETREQRVGRDFEVEPMGFAGQLDMKGEEEVSGDFITHGLV